MTDGIDVTTFSCPSWGSDVLDRLMRHTRVQPAPPDSGLTRPCLVWTGAHIRRAGNISYGCRAWYVHRLAWTAFVGEIPADRPQLHHVCQVGDCWEPSHLLPVSQSEHARLSAAARTMCGRKLHPRPADGGPCRECKAAAYARYWERRGRWVRHGRPGMAGGGGGMRPGGGGSVEVMRL